MRLKIPPTTRSAPLPLSSLLSSCTAGSLRSGLGHHNHTHPFSTWTRRKQPLQKPLLHQQSCAPTSPRSWSVVARPNTAAAAAATMTTAATSSPSALPAAEQAALVDASKRAAAFRAVQEHMDVAAFRNVGVGSGSTVVYVVEALRALGPAVTDRVAFFSTGDQSRDLIKAAGFRLQYIQDLPEGAMLDVAFDGADEVDEELNLIKGGGACLFQEKLVVTKAKKFVCVADFRKNSARLGEQWKKGIPIEVVPNATGHVLSELKKLGSLNPQIRSGLPGKAGAVVTDNGNALIDAPFPPLALAKDLKGEDGANGIWTVDGLADKLIKIVGVVEAGLFCGSNGYQAQSGAQKPVAAYFGMADGSIEVRKAS